MEEFQRLLGVVAATLNKPADEVAEAVKSDEGVSTLTQSFKDYRKSQYDDGHKAAEKKIKGTVEAALRKRGAADATFDELDSALDTVETTAREKGGQKLTDEDVLKHDVVKKLLNAKDREAEAKVAQAAAEAQKSLDEKVLAFRKEQTDAKVEAAARHAITALNPNLHADPAKAARQVARLVADIKAGSYEVTNAGEVVPLDADGLTRKNEQGHPVKFAELVRETVLAEFDLPASTAKDAPVLTAEQIAAGAKAATGFIHYKGEAPKTKADALALADDRSLSLEAREELLAFSKAE